MRCKKYWAVKKRPSLKFVASLLAIVAVAAEQNFGDFAELLAEAKAASGKLDLVHAGYSAAIDANEMRVSRTVAIVL